jgi:hypothetical protein
MSRLKKKIRNFQFFIGISYGFKKTILVHEGEMNFEAFVIKGCVRKYYIDANGFEVILQFAIENAWVSDISFSIYEEVGYTLKH